MKIAHRLVIGCMAGFAALGLRAAGEEFKWAPVTSADWAIAADSAKGIRSAVIIFEKFTEDDQDILNGECRLTLYRRIKIFNSEGREWGDVSVPYVSDEQKIEDIRGRTILPNGSEIALSASQIREKEIYRSEGIRVRQRSFSLPGMTDNCIVEYYIKYQLPRPNPIWLVQKHIYLLAGEYDWKFFHGQGLNAAQYSVIQEEYRPNYLWLNTQNPGTVEQLPNLKEPEEVLFTIKNVPAFEEEPMSLPENTLLVQLRMYYGKAAIAGYYWGELAQAITRTLGKYTKDEDKVMDVLTSLGTLEGPEVKLGAAYRWLQLNITNTSYTTPAKKPDRNNNVNDVLDRRYGTGTDINYVFYDMLRDMNIDAKMAFVLDRTEGLLVTDAKYWQFDGTMVAVKDSAGKYRFYSPGNRYLPVTHAPWFNEGTLALIVGDQSQQFAPVPYTAPEQNREQRSLDLRLRDDLTLAGTLKEQLTGHGARTIRFLADGTQPKELQEKLKKDLQDDYPNAEFDSISAGGTTDQSVPVTIETGIRFSSPQSRLGARILLKPFASFAQVDNPFTAGTRRNPILFKYAYDRLEAVTIAIPDSYAVEALPADTSFAGKAGRCEMKVSTFERAISIQRSFKLSSPFWLAASYDMVRQLFKTWEMLDGITIVLKKI